MKTVPLCEIFDIEYGNSLALSDLTESENGVFFVSRTENHNGVSATVALIENITPNPKNTITVAVGGSVMSSFLQKRNYYTGYHILILHPKTKLSDNEMLYYCMCLRANKYRYSYGRQANKTLDTLLVPSLDNIPDWVNIAEVKNPSKKPITNKVFELKTKQWQYFLYTDIFEIKKGKVPKTIQDGNIFLVSATGLNNGVSKTISSSVIPNNRNLITVSSNGDVGDAFYQNKEFYATGDINILIPKFKTNPLISMFLNTLIRREKFRFNYGRKWSKEKMLNHKIKLPVDKNNQPDWQFMENYIKTLPYSKLL